MVLAGLVVGIVGLWNLSRFYLGTSKTQSVGLSNESARYLESIFSGQIPPRFDSYENAGFGDASFIFQYPLQIWIRIPASLLGFSGSASRSINFITTIGFFLWGLRKVDAFFKTRNFTLARIIVVVLSFVALEILNSELSIALMLVPWLVWVSARFVKAGLAYGKHSRSQAISKEGLTLVFILSLSALTSATALAVGVGVLIGVAVIKSKAQVRTIVICLLWALANSIWFLLPQYAERAEVIIDHSSGSFNAKTFDEKKASEIFDDYPNQNVISPNAAVKIIPDQRARHTNSFTVIVPEKSLLIQKTMYFPGWRVKANDQPVTLENPADHAGLVAYQLEAGTHLVTSQMTQLTIPRIVGNSLSIVSVAIWVWCMQKAKRLGMTNVQRLFRISLSSKERLAKIMRKFWRRQNQ